MTNIELVNEKGGDAISAGVTSCKKTINTRTQYMLCGSDFSQQE